MAYSPNPQLVAAIRNAPAHLRQILLATALVESGGRLDAVGDSGSSFGPYQFNRAGRLASAGFTPQQAMDPRLATEATVREFQTFYDRGARGADLAYRAQRPADQADYMAKINNALGAARDILGGAASSGSGVTNEAHLATTGAGGSPSPSPGASPYSPTIPAYAQRDPSAYARRMLAMGEGDAGMWMNMLRSGSPFGRFATQMGQPQDQTAPTPAVEAQAQYPEGGYEWAQKLAKRFGLSLASTYRSPEQNASVGGSPTSAHMTQGGAADFAGPAENMRRLAEWAVGRGAFGEVFYDPLGRYWDNGKINPGGIGGHSDHVHITRGGWGR